MYNYSIVRELEQVPELGESVVLIFRAYSFCQLIVLTHTHTRTRTHAHTHTHTHAHTHTHVYIHIDYSK